MEQGFRSMSQSRSRLARAEHRPDLPGTFRWPEPETFQLLAVVPLALLAPRDALLAALHSRAQLGWPRWRARSAVAPPGEFERRRLTL